MKPKKPNAKGRNTTEKFVMLKGFMLQHPSWRSLDPKACCIYIELCRLFNGSNNGEIGLSCRDAKKIAHCGKSTASKMFQQLIDRGFIRRHNKGLFGNRHATTWILTNQPYGNKPQTDDWVHWTPKKNAVPQNKLKVPVAELNSAVCLNNVPA